MNTCKTCKHWSPYKEKFDREYHGKHSGRCDNEKFAYKESSEKVEPDGLMYWDYEGYSAGFETGRDFGCIHHATKSDAASERAKEE